MDHGPYERYAMDQKRAHKGGILLVEFFYEIPWVQGRE